MEHPLLSIITVNYNNNEGLKKTIKSIKEQSFKSYEHIIIDAGSSDGSEETIKGYAKSTKHLTFWVSEPDNGIYDGMNKGILHANGEYLYFLNSGDSLKNEVLNLIPFNGTQYIYGNINVKFNDESSWIWEYPDTFDTFFIANKNGWISQQACFIHHTLFKDQLYNTEYKIISDWIHAVRSIIFDQCTYKHLNITIVDYDGNGASSNQERTWAERDKWINENIPNIFLKSFLELESFRATELGDLVPKLNKTHKFKKRIKKIITILYVINSIFSIKRKRK